jgi:hypothetical protein
MKTATESVCLSRLEVLVIDGGPVTSVGTDVLLPATRNSCLIEKVMQGKCCRGEISFSHLIRAECLSFLLLFNTFLNHHGRTHSLRYCGRGVRDVELDVMIYQTP